MIKIRLKNRPYGFLNSNFLPDSGYEHMSIPTEEKRIAVTGDYSDIADNHCACVCAMNMILLLRRHRFGNIDRCRLGNDRLLVFKSIHRIFGNGPVVFFKPKFTRFLKAKGAKIGLKPVRSLEDIEKSIKEKTPIAMLVNAGITHWHWILVIGIRKYENGNVYLNILDGWNKRTNRFLKYSGRETFIRALKPVYIL